MTGTLDFCFSESLAAAMTSHYTEDLEPHLAQRSFLPHSPNIPRNSSSSVSSPSPSSSFSPQSNTRSSISARIGSPSHASFSYNIGSSSRNGSSFNGSPSSNGFSSRYANPVDRRTIMNTRKEFEDQRRAKVDSLEEALSRLDLGSAPIFTGISGFHRTPPLFNKHDLARERDELVRELRHFTFLENKKFYKPMDKMIDYVDQDGLIVAFSKLHPPPLPSTMDISRFEYAKPCAPIQMNHLRLFNRLPRAMPAKYSRAFRRAVAHVSALMELPDKLPMPTKETLAGVRFDGSKFAGLDYARNGYKKRADAHPVALPDAQTAWDKLIEGRPVRPHDARMGGKGKLIERDPTQYGRVQTDGTDISMGRLILMLSHRDLLILGALEQPLTRSYLEEQWPIYIGQSWYHGGAEKFVNKMAGHALYHCFDAKKFDAAIDGWLVREALLILRQQFEGGMDPKYDTLWSFVYESLVEVVICRDDGIRLQKHVGTTSGNCFNTLVQSIITMLLGYTALIFRAEERMGPIGIEKVLTECELEVLGDDMVLALEHTWIFMTKEILAEVVQDCFNIDWSGKKSFTTRQIMDDSLPDTSPFKGIQFLGMYFRHQRWGDGPFAPKIVVPYRPFRESYLSLLFPKHGDYSREHSWLRALGIYLNAAGNKDTQLWLEKYMDFLELVPFVRPDAWPPSMIRMVTKDYWGLGMKPPSPDRISIDEWYRIVCAPRESEE
ncbi:hypothetical protein BGZ70_006434 [Mortierella alpina]|uniref:RdRp catalytic domain-containing protein n=1 Tax=Mortierella alpina TaxID=64518 RepID=A0A9P6JA00_MORAP|nr:hypothetical protein BGZ70_006434 [Mortierella alpina]